jgi:hypothetical protein
MKLGFLGGGRTLRHEISGMLEGKMWRKLGAYRDEISHGEVVRQGGRNFLVLALELCAAGYHHFLRRVTNGEGLDCRGNIEHRGG